MNIDVEEDLFALYDRMAEEGGADMLPKETWEILKEVWVSAITFVVSKRGGTSEEAFKGFFLEKPYSAGLTELQWSSLREVWEDGAKYALNKYRE